MRDLRILWMSSILTLPLVAGCDGGGNDGGPDAAIVIEWDAATSPSVLASWEVCTGQRGECSESCCVSRFGRTIQTEQSTLSCEVVDAGDGSYQVSFTAASTLESQPSLSAQGLVIRPSRAGPTPVESCTSFAVTESGSSYSTSTCNALDVRADPPGGGGCVIEASISSDGVIDLSFRCEEIGAQAPFLSTIYGDAVGPGEARIGGCQLQP
jgi:hypothetical protein